MILSMKSTIALQTGPDTERVKTPAKIIGHYENSYNYYKLHIILDATTTTLFGTDISNGYENTVGVILLAVYMLIANVLLLNLLIAIFG